MKTNHGSLFTGIGGFDLAAERCGIETVFQIEIDEYNNKVLEKNFPNAKRYSDIRTFAGTQYRGQIDILSGGFPCQDISLASQKGAVGLNGKRSGLWYEFARIITEISPRYVIIENVPNLRNMGLETILLFLAKSGYNAEWETLPYSLYGGHHRRRRLFIVAYPMQLGHAEKGIFHGVRKRFMECYKITTGQHYVSFKSQRDRLATLTRNIRGANGIPKGVDTTTVEKRINALGNAVVPTVAEAIFSEIIWSLKRDNK